LDRSEDRVRAGEKTNILDPPIQLARGVLFAI
jgi:hypothetical protein